VEKMGWGLGMESVGRGEVGKGCSGYGWEQGT
jgi:hypothetical protein